MKTMMLVLVLFWVAICLTIFTASRYACERYGEMTNQRVEHDLMTGCYVHTDSGVFLRDQIRSVN